MTTSEHTLKPYKVLLEVYCQDHSEVHVSDLLTFFFFFIQRQDITLDLTRRLTCLSSEIKSIKSKIERGGKSQFFWFGQTLVGPCPSIQ